MRQWFRFSDWPLRLKMAVLLVVASLVPIGFAAYFDIRDAEWKLRGGTEALLAARGDQLRVEIDTFNRGYQRSVDRISRFPEIGKAIYGQHGSAQEILDVYPASDPNIRGAAILDLSGTVRIATEEPLRGVNLSYHPFIRNAVKGVAVISDVYFARQQVGSVPTIAFLAPVHDTSGKTIGLAALWVRAEALWDVMKRSNGLAGLGSFAVLFDNQGIRIAHTYSDDIVFHPGGPLNQATIDSLVAEGRFGERTRQLLADVRAFPDQFNRSISATPDERVFRGFAPVNQKWNYGVARRFETVPWTVFYMVPEGALLDQIALVKRQKIAFAAVIILLALLLGAWCASLILAPVRALSKATGSMAEGDLSARSRLLQKDELGRLGASFDSMADRIQAQSQALERSRDELEQRVTARTSDLTKTAAQLKASEARTRLIIDTALDAVISMDSAGLISDWSPQAEAIFGWLRIEAIGRPLVETIIPHQYRVEHRAGLERYLETREGTVLNQRLELTALRRDGSEFPVELSITPIEVDGQVSFSAFLRDITERKRSESALRESQQLLRAVIDNSLAVIYVKDVEGRYLMVNRRYCDLFHLTEEAVLQKTDHDLFPKDVAEAFRSVDDQVARSGVAVTTEESAPLDDGVHTYISVKCPLFDSRGVPYAVFGISTDITERKVSEERLQTQLERLNLLRQITTAIGERQDLRSIFQVVVRTLEDHLPVDFCCVCLYDSVDEVLTVTSIGVQSEALAQELAMTERARIVIDENGLSRCVRGQLVYEPDITDVKFPFPERLARGGLQSLVISPLMIESQVFGVLVSARKDLRSFSSGECEFLRLLSEHVALAAHQAQLHGALQQAYDDLRQTQQAIMQQERLRALGQMASGIAHDINNAISPVALYTESLLETEPNLSGRAREYLETISRAIDDVAATIARMREFYRQREVQLELAPVDLNRLVREVIDLTRARWNDMPQQRGVVIDVVPQLDPDLATIMGVESEIREVLTNLVFNAIDAMPEGGTITIRTRSHNGAERVSLEVVDDGIGMDEETRRRCLEPFFTTKGERGTGLGLAMVYGVAQRHSADIEIDSALGQGTTFRLLFTVPSISANIGEDVQPSPRVPPMRILLVDDDPLLLKSLRDILEIEGHAITATKGGQEGIDVCKNATEKGEPFPVVITDLGMPYVDGRQVAGAVKDLSPSTFVILLTGWGHRLVAEGDIPAHVDYVLNKPPKLRDLREALSKSRKESNE